MTKARLYFNRSGKHSSSLGNSQPSPHAPPAHAHTPFILTMAERQFKIKVGTLRRRVLTIFIHYRSSVWA